MFSVFFAFSDGLFLISPTLLRDKSIFVAVFAKNFKKLLQFSKKCAIMGKNHSSVVSGLQNPLINFV